MTTERLIEAVQEHFPELRETLIVQALNNAMTDLVSECDAFRKWTTLTISTGSVAVPTGQITVEKVKYQDSDSNYHLMPKCLDDVELGTSYGNGLSDYMWYIDTGYPAAIKVVVNTSNSALELVTDAVLDEIEVFGLVQPTAISVNATTASPGIDAQFHEALVDKVLSDRYAVPRLVNGVPDPSTVILQLAGWYGKKYELAKHKAKKFYRSDYSRSTQIRPVEF